jgi:glycosyltransferase involved in cell wall biosynthesis
MKKNLLIDALSTSSGGAVSHLQNLLANFGRQTFFTKVVVYLPKKTIRLMPKNKNIDYKYIPFGLDYFLFFRLFYQIFVLNFIIFFLNKFNCIFVTGGSHIILNKNVVTISQNLLPFVDKEVKRYSKTFFYLKLKILKFTQTLALKSSSGIIFLHKYSKKIILNQLREIRLKTIIIPHGIKKRFKFKVNDYKKFRIIYVSNIDFYKNHDFVIKSLDLFLDKYPIFQNRLTIEFYGSKFKPAYKIFQNYLNQSKYKKNYKYFGVKTHNFIYANENKKNIIFLFASSCENFSVSLIEAMSYGIPIICNNLQPMKSVLRNSAVFFKYNNSESFVDKMFYLLSNFELRKKISSKSYHNSKLYDHIDIALKTYKFLKHNSN